MDPDGGRLDRPAWYCLEPAGRPLCTIWRDVLQFFESPTIAALQRLMQG